MKIDKWFHLYGRKDDVVFEEVPFENLPSAEQWIPCWYELPRVGKYVLISVKGNVYEAHLRESEEYFITHKSLQYIRENEVDAWMDLPKAYEGRTE